MPAFHGMCSFHEPTAVQDVHDVTNDHTSQWNSPISERPKPIRLACVAVHCTHMYAWYTNHADAQNWQVAVVHCPKAQSGASMPQAVV